jgi:hypothetical protein
MHCILDNSLIVGFGRQRVQIIHCPQTFIVESEIVQTPDGSFLDVTRNGFELLTSCGVQMPKMESNHCYVDSWPPFIVLLHPAMGPLWDITRQKVALLPFGSHLVFSCQNSTKKNRITTFLQQQDIDNSVGSEIISI